VTITEKEIKELIRERLGQIIILSDYLSERGNYHKSYVDEKSKGMPVLDKMNKRHFNVISDYLENEYGVDVSDWPW